MRHVDVEARKRGSWGVSPGHSWNLKLLYVSFNTISVKEKWFIETEREPMQSKSEKFRIENFLSVTDQ